ncbi:4'-phosphopantetheinyl transferase family protein [Streptomyces sp. NPDC059479]|uniref:4'-phosphopantetheinyl transferase family protein n=1 Tax=Streptomyces sp. NPDC059479 TaxID=3346848 RepID=UPI0036C4CFDF
MLAIAGAPVGIDIEAGDRVPPALFQQLHPDEQTAVLRLPATRRREALLARWVRREAYRKAVGTGPVTHPNSTETSARPVFGSRGGADATDTALTVITAPPGYAAAAALLLKGSSYAVYGCP